VAEYATSADIANRALQMLGAKLIVNLTDNSRNAVQVNFLYDKLRVAELRAHVWNFAIMYASLGAPVAVTYQNGQQRNAYTLPAGFQRLANQEPRTAGNATQTVSGGIRFRDFTVEGGRLVTALATPVELRYIGDVTNVALMDALFIEALAAHIAQDLAEVITNAPAKRQLATAAYTEAIARARAINLIEAASDEPSEEDWQQDRLLREKAPKPPQAQRPR
jgi:hypothetical protein